MHKEPQTPDVGGLECIGCPQWLPSGFPGLEFFRVLTAMPVLGSDVAGRGHWEDDEAAQLVMRVRP